MPDGFPRSLPARNRLLRAGLGIVVVLTASACDTTPRVGEPDIVDALHPDASSEMTATVGELVAFDLPGHAGTGYEWMQKGPTPAFLQAVGRPRFTSEDPERMGAHGSTRFLFEVLEPGEGDLQFDYLRAWEKNTAPVRRATVKVTAIGDGSTRGTPDSE